MNNLPTPHPDDKPVVPAAWADLFQDTPDTEHVTELHDPTVPGEDGLVFASPLQAMRHAIGEPALRVTPEERHVMTEASHDPTLFGENKADDLAFKQILQHIVADTLPHPPRVTYNPGSGIHVSLAEAFPDARTIFTDISGDVQHDFVTHNALTPDHPYEFYRADMHEFRLPNQLTADLVLLLNAEVNMSEEELDAVTHPGSIILVNGWHGADEHMQHLSTRYVPISTYPFNDGRDNLHAFQRLADPQ